MMRLISYGLVFGKSAAALVLSPAVKTPANSDFLVRGFSYSPWLLAQAQRSPQLDEIARRPALTLRDAAPFGREKNKTRRN